MAELNRPPAPRAFRYLLDPIFLGASCLFGANRFFLKARFGSRLPFLRSHWNDCYLIPVALPLLLWIFRKTRLRSHDAPPTWPEIFQWTLLWSLLFEGIFPLFFKLGTADWRDVLCYAAGAALAGYFWNKPGSSAASHSPPLHR
jgi:hypothetical protein